MPWYSPWGYVMWACEHCGTYGIAAELTKCPHCQKERDMPKTTVAGGPSNGVPEPEQPEEKAPARKAPARKTATRKAKEDGDGEDHE